MSAVGFVSSKTSKVVPRESDTVDVPASVLVQSAAVGLLETSNSVITSGGPVIRGPSDVSFWYREVKMEGSSVIVKSSRLDCVSTEAVVSVISRLLVTKSSLFSSNVVVELTWPLADVRIACCCAVVDSIGSEKSPECSKTDAVEPPTSNVVDVQSFLLSTLYAIS